MVQHRLRLLSKGLWTCPAAASSALPARARVSRWKPGGGARGMLLHNRPAASCFLARAPAPRGLGEPGGRGVVDRDGAGAGAAGPGPPPQGEMSVKSCGRRAREAAGEVKVSGCEAPDAHRPPAPGPPLSPPSLPLRPPLTSGAGSPAGSAFPTPPRRPGAAI